MRQRYQAGSWVGRRDETHEAVPRYARPDSQSRYPHVCHFRLSRFRVSDRGIGALDVLGLFAVSPDPLRSHFSKQDLTIEAEFRQDIEGHQ